MQTGAFHEFIGDLTAILLALFNNDIRHRRRRRPPGGPGAAGVLAELAEQFGREVEGRPYLRTARNDETMRASASLSPHTVSQVLTGAMFDILIGIAANTWARTPPATRRNRRTPARTATAAGEDAGATGACAGRCAAGAATVTPARHCGGRRRFPPRRPAAAGPVPALRYPVPRLCPGRAAQRDADQPGGQGRDTARSCWMCSIPASCAPAPTKRQGSARPIACSAGPGWPCTSTWCTTISSACRAPAPQPTISSATIARCCASRRTRTWSWSSTFTTTPSWARRPSACRARVIVLE